MILFKSQHVEPILRGRKTQTRRGWKRRRAVPGATHGARTAMFGEPFARLRILRVWQERLGEISAEDVLAEGYDMAQAYFVAYWNINKIRDQAARLASLDELVWCVEFEVVPCAECGKRPPAELDVRCGECITAFLEGRSDWSLTGRTAATVS